MQRITPRKARKISYHVISGTALLAVLLVGVFCFQHVFYRTWEALRDFGLSVAYYFVTLLGLRRPEATVTRFPKEFIEALPQDWENFKICMKQFGELFISSENFHAYTEILSKVLFAIGIGLAALAPVVLVSAVLAVRHFKRQNNDYNKTSKPLQIALKFRERVYMPVHRFVIGFFTFFKNRKYYWIPLLCMGLYFLNVGTIVVELTAYILYFAMSFDVGNLYVQVVKLASDMTPMFRFFPWYVWAVVFLVLICMLRKKIAYALLNHYEESNRSFIESRPIVYMVCGTMGKGKTTILTDMAQSQEVMFREKAYEKLRENDMKFPNFPWINLERFIRQGIRHHSIYTLASVRKLVREMKAAFYCEDEAVRRGFRRHFKRCYGYKHDNFAFDYDYEAFGLQYDNKLYFEELFEVLETYAQLYFIYVLPTSMIVSNFSVRSDDTLQDEGNFPLYDDDFFKRPTAMIKGSRMSHVVDFDFWRLGRKFDAKNPLQDAFEYGIGLVTEIGKERGNQKDMEGLKRDVEEANQKNDLFNSELKLIRHSSTVDNFPFVRFICDEQRPESWGADARDLCDIVDVKSVGESKIILPFFVLEEATYLISSAIFNKIYEVYRFNRGDSTLTMWILKWLHSKIYNHYKRIENTFSTKVAKLSVQAGTMDEGEKKAKYYLSSKKIYAMRFSTDCYSGFYTEKCARSGCGLMDIPTYQDIKPSFDEMNAQHSYLITGVTRAFEGGENAFKEPEKGGKKGRIR